MTSIDRKYDVLLHQFKKKTLVCLLYCLDQVPVLKALIQGNTIKCQALTICSFKRRIGAILQRKGLCSFYNCTVFFKILVASALIFGLCICYILIAIIAK